MNSKTNKFQLVFSILMGVSMLCLYVLPEGWFKYLLFMGLVIPYQIYEFSQKRRKSKEALFQFRRNENGRSFQVFGAILFAYLIWIMIQIKADLASNIQSFPIANYFYQIFIVLIFFQLVVSREWYYISVFENHFTLHLPQRIDVDYAQISHFYKRDHFFYITNANQQITIDLRHIKPDEVSKLEEVLTKQILSKRA